VLGVVTVIEATGIVKICEELDDLLACDLDFRILQKENPHRGTQQMRTGGDGRPGSFTA
jgi:hypothetical protein